MIKNFEFQPLGTIRTFKYDEVVSFCKVREQWGEFSNMSNAFPVKYEGILYPTSEHLYIAGLFWHNHRIQAEILSRPLAMYCKRKFRSKAYLPFARKDWHDVNVEWMKHVLNLKYQQSPKFRQLLESTGDQIILEDSTLHTGKNPYGGHSSFFWGSKGFGKTGSNKFRAEGIAQTVKIRWIVKISNKESVR